MQRGLKQKFVRGLAILACLLPVLITGQSTQAQGLSALVTLTVRPGFDGYFRAHQWMPLRITVQNNGDAITGRLVVRPETSGNALTNTFSTPVDLPSGSNQVIWLYITARANAQRVRVELLDENNRVVADRDVSLVNVRARDRLYAVVSGAAAGSVIDLAPVHIGGYDSYQANWSISDVPDRAAALSSVDVIIFNATDTGTLTGDQRSALTQWVTRGGHLIVTGGTGWQSTAAGLVDLLPLVPENAAPADGLRGLVRLAGEYNTVLRGQYVLATGALTEDARVLAATDDDTPLVIRREVGSGTIDYIAVDPNAQPLRSWAGLSGLWFSLLTSTNVRPAWTYGFADWERASDAIGILPGLNLLPEVSLLASFLLGYIFLVGPFNYFLLSRLNRRALAWVTIPILIIIFSILARTIGFNLRGNQATLSRLSIIQTWPDSDEAQVDQLIGLLAPRRGTYSIDVSGERMLRPIPSSGQNAGVLGGRAQVNANIEQTGTFRAVDFPVDDSYIAGFSTSGVIPRPDVGGRVTLSLNSADRLQRLRGSIRNDTDQTLHDPVILARGVSYQLVGALEPGTVRTFEGDDLVLAGNTQPSPSPMEFAPGEANPYLVTNFFRSPSQVYSSEASRTAIDILGPENYNTSGLRIALGDDAETQEQGRRQAFLESFIIDQFASTARGNRVFLAAWTSEAPFTEVVDGAGWRAMDTTLYLIELEVEVVAPRTRVTISQDQFSWVTLARVGASDVGPFNFALYNEAEVIFRFTPLPESILATVDELTLIVRRPASIATLISVEIWNWQEEMWEFVTIDTSGRFIFDDHVPYLGPQNAIHVRIRRPDTGSTIFIEQMAVEQRGRF